MTKIGTRFIAASKNCSAKLLSDVISKVFNMIFNCLKNFHKRVYFGHALKISGCRYWLPIAIKLKKKTKKTRKKPKSISTFDFTTLYTTIAHNLINKVLSEKINFVFKPKTQSCIGF